MPRALPIDQRGEPLFESDNPGYMRSDPFGGAVAVAPNDAADLAQVTRGLYVGGAGNVKVDLLDTQGNRTTATFTALPVGIIHPLRVIRVYLTGTTATNVLALY